jgi:ABC-2 type transport system permease protein
VIGRGVFFKTLWERRRSLIGWSAGLVFVVLITVAPYASFRNDPALEELTKRLPDFVRALTGGETDFLSPEGWLNGRLFALMLPLLFATFAIGRGADGVAGEEGRGTLELVLATPISRFRFFLAKLGALAAGLAIVTGVTLLALAVMSHLAQMDVPLGNLAVAMGLAYLLAFLHGTLALAVGAGVGKRGVAVATAAVVAVGGYIVDSLAELWDVAERVRFLSPFAYADANGPLRGELPVLDFLVLAAAIGAAVYVGATLFERRDLRI